VATVGIVVHHGREQAWKAAADLVAWLEERSHACRIAAADAELIGQPSHAWAESELVDGLDLLVGIGGDGTILRAVDLAADAGVAVLGVNAGQLGYLSAVEPDGIRIAMKRFLAGSYAVEERLRLQVSWTHDDGSPGTANALNEVVLERSQLGHTVRILLGIDGDPFTPFVVDGLIVATPTGSTAYALSVGGPIIAPSHRALLISPVSPHMLFDRSLVLDPGSEVSLTVEGHRTARLSVDGRDAGIEVRSGQSVTISAAATPARLVVFGPHRFLDVLRSKFALADR
jgi:NAD+ kinase